MDERVGTAASVVGRAPAEDGFSELSVRYEKRNYWLGVASGIAYNLYTAILSTELVMTWFLSELTTSNLIIGLLVPIESGSWCFLQFVLSGYLQRQPRSLPLYRLMALVRVLASGALALFAFLLEEPSSLLILFLLLFTVNSVAAGMAALPFLNVMAKTVRPHRRGMFIGWRRFVGGFLGLLAGALVTKILAPGFIPFPDNYALLFLMGFLTIIVLVGTFSLIKEPAEVVDSQRIGFKAQLRRSLRLPASDKGYARYLIVRLLIAVAASVMPFYTVYARRILDVPDDTVGVYMIGLALASTISNLVVGQLGDRRGNRLLMRLAALTSLLLPASALLAAGLAAVRWDMTLFYVVVYMLIGLHRAAIVIGGSNYVLDLAPADQRPTYVGFAYGIVGLALFLSPLAGKLADWLGFVFLFSLAAMCGAAAFFWSMGLAEPRLKGVGDQGHSSSDR